MSEIQNRRMGFGIVLIVAGLLFLLENLGLIHFELWHRLRQWEVILIVIGTVILISDPKRKAGWILIMIGAFFLLPDLFYIPWYSTKLFWPVILIAVGFIYMMRQRGHSHNTPQGEKPDGSMDFIDDTNVFGGGDVIITANNFKGGKITSIFGGGNYDLTNAKLSAEPTVIDFFAMFGGGNFTVPADWNVKTEVTAIFGGFSDKRKTTLDPGTSDPTKELYIKGFVLFGGGELKSY
jgi:predicted membrane protein